jgi:hypothetical protein
LLKENFNISFLGEDVILNLPNNEVDLHGNMSSDDHGIVGWEWTRANTQPGLVGYHSIWLG